MFVTPSGIVKLPVLAIGNWMIVDWLLSYNMPLTLLKTGLFDTTVIVSTFVSPVNRKFPTAIVTPAPYVMLVRAPQAANVSIPRFVTESGMAIFRKLASSEKTPPCGNDVIPRPMIKFVKLGHSENA